ncbi:MAG TPA: tetratricopeptide repeat protein [Burkholderiales bacterium]|nr:tetratricopeptide repeat protein [Burkholderiales bacterium]
MKRLLLAACIGLAACAVSRAPRETATTLGSLEKKRVVVDRDAAVDSSRAAAIQAYRKFLDAAPRDRMRPEAMRRLGDLEIERARDGVAEGAGAREYRDAIRTYEDLLRAYPAYPGNDRVLYQLSHAYDQAGDLGRSLATLDRLVGQYPRSVYRDEAEFRRGELLFTLRRYAEAEQAYGVVIRKGSASAFYERALYMHGWSLFKQARLEEALPSFAAVLDRKLIGRDNGAALEDLPGLTRADRELTEDTFRVVSLSLINLQGADTVPKYFSTPPRRQYEFRVYQQLGELYLKQDRVADGAAVFNAFARRYPTHLQSPVLQSRAIQAYQQAGFTALALEAKKEFVGRYGVESEFHRINGELAYARVSPYVKTHIEELARHYHAVAQKGRKTEDYQEAARWYRAYVSSFPGDPHAPGLNFLLAESLFEDKRFATAAAEYERTAYDYPRHEKSADAGYAALLAYAQQEKQAKGDDLRVVRTRSVESALRFADANPGDARSAGVLTDAAEKLYANNDASSAAITARRVLALQPPAVPELRRTAWTVVAHVDFQQGAFDRSEKEYREALALTPRNSPTRAGLTDRLAASVYKQGEQARAAGQLRAAADHFLRVGTVAPNSPIRATAQYDAAAALIALKDWNAAAPVLEGFRRDYPGHPLQAEVPGKLAACYLESGQTLKAAGELEALSATGKDVALGRDSLWQAAGLYDKGGSERNAAAAYERYVRQYPRPLESAVEARYRLAEISRKEGRPQQRQAWSRELVEAEQKGGNERTDRTRYLGSLSALVMAEPLDEAYRDVRLVEPLKKNLKRKKDRLQQALQAYAIAADYGVSEAATTATYRTAELYNDFGKAMLDSQRPKRLSKDELEQYNVMLEEQAYPFEEKAIELHEINVRRVRSGIYDGWVKRSYTALGKLRPVRYAKAEKDEGVINALH